MLRNFKNILVTGGCGFIGTNFIHWLFKQKNFNGRLINFDFLTYAANPHNLDIIKRRYGKRYIFIRGDIAEKSEVEKVFKKYDIDTVVHFAAESHVDRSIKNPENFIRTNIIGTFNLLEAALKQKHFNLFQHISTDEVFGSLGEFGFFTEKTAYDPSSPYSASKASSDHLVKAYQRTYSLPTIISNCSNNYGPFQFPEKLIPLMIINAIEMKPLPIYGDGRNIRDWLFVDDHCHAIWLIMNHGKIGDTYAIGGNSELDNLSLVKRLCDIIDLQIGNDKSDSRRNLITFVDDRPGHDRRYAINFNKLKTELGWIPLENIESGLKKTVRWYISHSDWIEQVRSGSYKQWMKQQYGDLS